MILGVGIAERLTPDIIAQHTDPAAVHTPGFVEFDDMPALYSMARALVFPSRYESFGIPIVEAMACGCPVITATTSACPEVAGDAAILVDPDDVEGLADAMYRVSLDDALAEDLRQRGLRRSAGFSWTASAKTLLGRAGGRRPAGVSPETLVLVISLADAAERRAGFAERARVTTLPWKFFDAHRELGAGLTYRPDEAVVAKGRPLTPGELGCYSSHYHAWLALLDSQAAQMIVLEDDTIVDWTFLEKLATVDFRTLGVLPATLRQAAVRVPAARRSHRAPALSGRIRRLRPRHPGVRHHSSGSRTVRSPLPPGAAAGGRRAGPRLGSRRAMPGRIPFPADGDLQRLDHRVGAVERPEIPAALRGARLRMRVLERARRITRWLRVMTRLRSPAPGLRHR